MKLDDLNRICFTVCIVCIIVGILIAMAMIWWTGGDNEIAWKCLATVSILFLGASLMLSVSKTFDRTLPDDRRQRDEGDG
jgi:hypothetical protein